MSTIADLNRPLHTWIRRLRVQRALTWSLRGLIVGLLAWWIPEVWGNGFDGVREILAATIAPDGGTAHNHACQAMPCSMFGRCRSTAG